MPIQPEKLRKSFAVISYKSDELSQVFYDLLFTRHPELRPLFGHTRMEEQKKKFIRSLVVALRHLDQPDFLTDYLEGLGKMHRAFGAKPEHYPILGECLLDALEKTSGDFWKPELREAWREALEHLSETMQKGAGSD